MGLIIREGKILKQLTECFESDWSPTSAASNDAKETETPEASKSDVQRAAKVLAKELQPLTASVKKAVKKVVSEAGEDIMGDKRVKTAVKKMVKKAIKQAVKEVTDNAEAKEAE